jgi:transcriptional regulator with XRE-family HTH domain
MRAVRIRRGMRQSDVAFAAGVSRSVVSKIERGGLEQTTFHETRRVATALGVSISVEARWRGAEAAALLDERHATMIRAVVARLSRLGWQSFPEHTFNVWGERGSMDVFAGHPACRAMLSVEVKTRLADLQDLLAKMDRKRRLAPVIARDLGWKPLFVASMLVLPGETWARSAVERFGPVFEAALPARTVEAKRWLKSPDCDLRGIWFLLNDAQGSAKSRPGGSMRVRPRRPVGESPDSCPDPHEQRRPSIG